MGRTAQVAQNSLQASSLEYYTTVYLRK